ncbi:hypothetical protein [Jiella pelagia]|uniref:Uncharacterized protein n=1 Tax=Jiella pelagia TaxID=2986949 RepID=A0ABY7C2G8_9HYPH|nr:hypothetical protein [Jiella pelagia]WAP69070.1 hypothetical protein OH818_01665 [Jiella pelagia]
MEVYFALFKQGAEGRLLPFSEWGKSCSVIPLPDPDRLLINSGAVQIERLDDYPTADLMLVGALGGSTVFYRTVQQHEPG